MLDRVLDWLLSVLGSAGAVAVVAYLMRDTVSKYFTRAIENRFEKQMETFKAEIRDNEKELEQVRSFLVAARRERDSALLTKRLEAAETILRARNILSKLSMIVEYIQMLNEEKLLRDGDDPKVSEFVETLLQPLNLDENLKQLSAIDRTVAKLYLSDRSIKMFEAYEGIIMQAAMIMKIHSIPLRDKRDLIKAGTLSNKVLELVPSAQEGFDRWGERYAYHWYKYFHDQVLISLRQEVSGADDFTNDSISIERLAVQSRQAQTNIRSSLERSGLPDTFIKADESAPEPPTKMTHAAPTVGA